MHKLPAPLSTLLADPTRAAVVVDFDGTLAPIVDLPEDARAAPAAREALGALVGRVGLVAVVSGRPVTFLHDRLALDGVALVGQYGLERFAGDTVLPAPEVEPFLDAVAAAADEAERTWPDLVIERKGRLAVGVHWRTAPEHAPEPQALIDLAARHGLALLPGRMVCELRPDLPIDKGAALQALLVEHGTRRAMFAGDDVGDVPAFAALDRALAAGDLDAAVRVAVRSEEAPPDLLAQADLLVDGPEGVAAMLRALATALP